MINYENVEKMMGLWVRSVNQYTFGPVDVASDIKKAIETYIRLPQTPNLFIQNNMPNHQLFWAYKDVIYAFARFQTCKSSVVYYNKLMAALKKLVHCCRTK